ncbi:MAG: D-aminoacylase [Burkholderiaceae bacterium]|nr:D-aminoacylase [Burkholderiaceae bacterium]
MTADLLIRGAMVFDGSGAPGQIADVAIAGDRIVAIGADLPPARQQLAGEGRVLAPGFIDAHTHDDTALAEPLLMAPKLLQGVTTVITGNCGISAAPWSRPDRPPPPLDLLDRRGVDTASFAGYLDQLRRSPLQVNAAPLLGLTSVRAQVMDDTALRADAGEIERMQAVVAQALSAGAIGVSIGTYYPPARAADADEIVAVCAALDPARHRLTVHLRDEGDDVLAALDEAMSIASRLRVPLVVSHHKLMGTRNHGRARQTLGRIDHYARLAPVCLDCYPYAASSTMLNPAKAAACPRVIVTWSDAVPAQAGRDLDHIARDWGCSRSEAATRLLPGGAIYFAMDEADVRAILSHPLTMVGSDGLPHDRCPHPRLWGSFARVLGPLVRDAGWLSLPAAIHKMTGLPAERFGLTDRGALRVGALADLVLFDAARIADRATYALPTQPPVGIEAVIVNGRLRVRDGVLIGAGSGRLLG